MKTWQHQALGVALGVAAACGGKTGSDDGAVKSGGSHATGGAQASGGWVGAAAAIGGTQASGGSIASATAIASGGTHSVITTTGGSPTGGASSTGGLMATGGTRTVATGPAVCTPSSCGSVIDANGEVFDCGFNNCPQEICGMVAANECPASCNAHPVCQSEGQTSCGLISDGCGGIIDCGTCPEGQCCGCISLTSNDDPAAAVPNVCVSDPIGSIPQACGTSDCGLKPDNQGSVIDCGPCCKPQTCDDACPPDPNGNIRECSPVNDGVRYMLACLMPDGCSGTINCWCTLA